MMEWREGVLSGILSLMEARVDRFSVLDTADAGRYCGRIENGVGY